MSKIDPKYIRMAADLFLLPERQSPVTKQLLDLVEEAKRLNISIKGMTLTDLEEAVKKAKEA